MLDIDSRALSKSIYNNVRTLKGRDRVRDRKEKGLRETESQGWEGEKV